VVASLSVQRLGSTSVEVNRELGQAALTGIARQIRARWAVLAGRDAAMWGKLAPGTPLERVWVVHPSALPAKLLQSLGGLPAEWLREDGTGDWPSNGAPPDGLPDAHVPAQLAYTSGSTGVPRGVIQTHVNLDANARAICAYLGLGPHDRAMATLPLYYCYGKSVLNTHLLAGGSVFFDPRSLYPRQVLESIGAERCTGFAGVPLTFELLRAQADPREVPMPALRYVTQAGGRMAPETVRWARVAFAPAQLFVMYGQTEATARLSYLPPDRAVAKEGSIGVPVEGIELRVADEAGLEVAPGQVGQLLARGASVTPGYFEAPEETAAILRDGWLWTGDLGYRDPDGFFFLTGRARELLKIGGHRVDPTEIEQTLAQHTAVLEAAVVGQPDLVGGEVAVAFVVLRDGSTGNDGLASELRKHCRARLPAFKVPKVVTFLPSLPRTGSGKVARHELMGGPPKR
jgi:acyl-coenzyme A synthetase/AMP-(fatty) acid ligase